MAQLRLDHGLERRIKHHLSAFSRHAFELEGRRAAAVALTLVPGRDDEVAFLLTRRASDLSHHPGQFALPGGRLDPGESPEDAARRELAEELGVALGSECVLGRLDDFATRSGFVITPVVLWGSDVHALTPNPREVAVAYRVPVRELYRPDVPVVQVSRDGDAPLLALPLVGTHVFSPTAAIVYQMREVAFEGRTTRVHHYEQPRFAWK